MEIFWAVADPTRRRLLDHLRSAGPLTIKELAAPLPMTRQAVTKHLDALAESGLVRAERRGRERVHRLAAEPLGEVDAWLAPYRAAWERRLARLKRHLGEEN